MKNDFHVLTRKEEIECCQKCALDACVTPQDKRCPARVADSRKRSAYRVRHNAIQRKMKAEGRGYWPDKIDS